MTNNKLQNNNYTHFNGRVFLTRGQHMVLFANGEWANGRLEFCLSRACEAATAYGPDNATAIVVAPNGEVVCKFRANRQVSVTWKWVK